MESFAFPGNLIDEHFEATDGVLIDAVLKAIIFKPWLFIVKWHTMAIYLNIQLCKMCDLQTQMADRLQNQLI